MGTLDKSVDSAGLSEPLILSLVLAGNDFLLAENIYNESRL